jgi:hypothetical protein
VGWLPPSSASPWLATSGASDALAERSKDGDAKYNPVVKVAKVEKKEILGLSHHDSDIIAAGAWVWLAA